MGKSQVAASYWTHEGDFDSPEVTEVIEVFCFLLGCSMEFFYLVGVKSKGSVASLKTQKTAQITDFELVPVTVVPTCKASVLLIYYNFRFTIFTFYAHLLCLLHIRQHLIQYFTNFKYRSPTTPSNEK